jgi:hypothetical protein
MNTHTAIQIINGADGLPAFVVIPYADYIKRSAVEGGTIPNEVIGCVVKDGMSPIKAWREYLSLTQADVAARLNMAPDDFAQLETAAHPEKPVLRRVAEAFGLTFEQLDF